MSVYDEPQGEFTVELYVGMKSNYGWELWQSEIAEYQDAVSEAQILEDHGFEWRILGANGKEYHPNLKARHLRRVA